jgi:hypothetical protein
MNKFTVTVAEKSPPKKENGPWWIKPTDPNIPGLFVWTQEKNGTRLAEKIEVGETYAFECTSRLYEDKPQYTIRAINPAEGSAAPQKGVNGAQRWGGKTPEEESRMIAMGHAVELVAMRGQPGTKNDVKTALEDLRDAWLEVFGNKDPLDQGDDLEEILRVN